MRTQTASMVPDSALGLRGEPDPGWVAAGEVAEGVGVRLIPWEGPEARAAATLVPPMPVRSRGLDTDRGAWDDLPDTHAVPLGWLACGAVRYSDALPGPHVAD